MKISELRQKTTVELEQELLSLREAQLKLRLQRGMGESPKSHQFKQLRRTIAQIKTLLKQQELANG